MLAACRVPAAAVAIALAAAGCQGQAAPAAEPEPLRAVSFAVHFDPKTYSRPGADAALPACFRLAGVSKQGNWTAQSLPPHHYIGFSGTAGEQESLRKCLEAVPAARVEQRPR